MSIFDTPKIQGEDPQTKALRDAEQQRAENDRIKSIQGQLSAETSASQGGFGLLSLLGPYKGAGLKSVVGSG